MDSKKAEPLTRRILKYARDTAAKTITVTYEDIVDGPELITGQSVVEGAKALIQRMVDTLGERPLVPLPLPLRGSSGAEVLSLPGINALVEAWESPEAAMKAVEEFQDQQEFKDGGWTLTVQAPLQA